MSTHDAPPEPSTTVGPNTAGATLRVHAANIEVMRGPDATMRARIAQPRFVIGSGASADLRLSDDSVSREHVRVELTASGLRLIDEASTNGTWIGGMRVRDITLIADAHVVVGASTIAIHIDATKTDLPLSARASFGDAIGVSAAMRHLFANLELAAQSDVTVLLEGESGVGKEVLAQAIHSASPRASGPFVPVDCGAIPASLIESELFGHERGAFTGADRAREGVFEQANGGTLFLDEIGELPLDLQPKLLRALESRQVRPVGGRGLRNVDLRVIAATNRNLVAAAQENAFRSDLYYRLAVVRAHVPPLRDRREDILPLARAFLARVPSFASHEIEPRCWCRMRGRATCVSSATSSSATRSSARIRQRCSIDRWSPGAGKAKISRTSATTTQGVSLSTGSSGRTCRAFSRSGIATCRALPSPRG